MFRLVGDHPMIAQFHKDAAESQKKGRRQNCEYNHQFIFYYTPPADGSEPVPEPSA